MFGAVQHWLLLAGSGPVYCAEASGWGLFPDCLYVNQLVLDVYIEWRPHQVSMFLMAPFNEMETFCMRSSILKYRCFGERLYMIPGCSLLITLISETILRFLVVLSVSIICHQLMTHQNLWHTSFTTFKDTGWHLWMPRFWKYANPHIFKTNTGTLLLF